MNDSSFSANIESFYQAVGSGLFAGLLAALLMHLTVPSIALLDMVFVYAVSMSTLRGWRELCGILTMLGTVILYFAVYETFALNSTGSIVSIALSMLLVALFVGYLIAVAKLTARAQVRGLNRAAAVNASESIILEDAESWEAEYFAALRAKHAEGKYPIALLVRPLLWVVLGILIAYWVEDRLLIGLATCVALFQVVVFGRSMAYTKRLTQPRVEGVMAADQRRPILFLRPFSLDALPVDAIGNEWYSFAKMFSWLDKRTFEELLVSTFEELGPVIAIGRPGEVVPLLGASREYVEDASWQELVLARAERSQFIIMEIDDTPGMEWEIGHVTERVGLQRILIVLPPGKDVHEPRSTEWYERWASLRQRFEFLPEVSEQTAGVMFDRDAQPIVVTTTDSSIQKRLTAIKSTWMQYAAESAIQDR